MENPHEVEQAVLLERIIKNVVSDNLTGPSMHNKRAARLIKGQDKCNEAVLEMNHCIRVSQLLNAMIVHMTQSYRHVDDIAVKVDHG